MTIATWPVWAVIPLAVVLCLAAGLAAVLDAAVAPTRGSQPSTPVAETARLLRQTRRTTPAPDALLWRIGTAGPLVTALLMAVVIPLGDHVPARMEIGLVWFNALDVLLWAFWWMAGWGPNSILALVGGYRFLAQALAYELPLMFALTAPAAAASSLDVSVIVGAQSELWYVVQMPVAFVVFLGCLLGFTLWGPFAAPLAADIAGGVGTEPTGIDRLLLLAGRYALLVVGSAMAVALFLGGGAGPWLPAWLWSVVKTLAVLVPLLAIRTRVPLLRADRYMAVAWTVVIPAVLLQVLVVSIVAVAGGNGGS